MSAIRVVGYKGALEHLKQRGEEMCLPALTRLTLRALQMRVQRKTIPWRPAQGGRVVMFDLDELDAWLTGAAAASDKKAA